jgi:hypothetical protein
MENNEDDDLQGEMGLKFPVITISVAYDDINEPLHVDLGSIPPFVAVSVFENILSVMKQLTVGPKITFAGEILAEPSDFSDYVDIGDFDDFDTDEDDEDDEVGEDEDE